MLKKSLIVNTDAKSDESQIYINGCIRISVLTPRLIRIEKSAVGTFVDLPSTAVWFRRFEAPEFTAADEGRIIKIETHDIILTVKKSNGRPLKIHFKDSSHTVPCFNKRNLKGTRRTLDQTYGKVKLEDGLISTHGVYVMNDSRSFLIGKDGMFTKREQNQSDLYVFAYGKDYRQTIKNFYKISSPVPMVPRFALGVWWSRYKQYTQDEYQDLMLRFKKENIPLTVATVDMDWHWTDLNTQFGTNYKNRIGTDSPVSGGWTGYSWNTDLFPDYKGFLRFLKNENLHTTLNLHPADGIRFFESMYDDMAKAMGIDPKTKQAIPFQCGSDKFWNAYFDVVHKPYENDGVDFWWIDWQQGTKCDVKGLDPLQPLNHYHYLDNAESGKIPLILSRYGGLGSHRYPLGFSGDTAINWDVLDFQPYFTINAANAAYTWWSHDIGGHHMGIRDDDLYMRWLEFGVFSPIMRLHSTSDDLLGKEPWKYKSDIYACAKKWLTLRHRMIPYTYTMDNRTHKEGIAICEPMYYSYPDTTQAYNVKNQYMFGSELMICPITTPNDKRLNMGSVKAWIPPGKWTDIFTFQSYHGPMEITLHRDIDTIPVLAKEGAVIPLSCDAGNTTKNPKAVELLIYSGNSTFKLYEDNGKTDCADHNAVTKFEVSYVNKTLTLEISAAAGDTAVIPESRDYLIRFKDIAKADTVTVNGVSVTPAKDSCLTITIDSASPQKSYKIIAQNSLLIKSPPKKEQLIYIMSRWQYSNVKKRALYRKYKHVDDPKTLMNKVSSSALPHSVRSAITERLSAD